MIRQLTSDDLLSVADGLADLLADVVDGGASVGFLSPLDKDAAVQWWTSLAPAVADERLLIWVSSTDGRIDGTVQLVRAPMPNSRKRGEIAKLLVRSSARGRGLGRSLLSVAEVAALDNGLSLLLLDTVPGTPAERLYEKAGWTRLGSVPGYAADPYGELQPTIFFYKTL